MTATSLVTTGGDLQYKYILAQVVLLCEQLQEWHWFYPNRCRRLLILSLYYVALLYVAHPLLTSAIILFADYPFRTKNPHNHKFIKQVSHFQVWYLWDIALTQGIQSYVAI